MNKRLIKNIVGTQEFFCQSMSNKNYDKNGVFAWVTGIDNKFLNTVIASNIDSEQTIFEVIQFFKNKNVPWTWMIGPLYHPDNLEELLINNGFLLHSAHPVMWSDITISLAELGQFDIREVTNYTELKDWGIPLNEGFGSSTDSSNKYIQLVARVPYGKDQNFHHYVLYYDNKPVSCATLSLSKYGARIDNVATCTAQLRKGFGKAITLFAMMEAKKLNYNMVCLESSDEGLPLYLSMGFREIYRNKIYEYRVIE